MTTITHLSIEVIYIILQQKIIDIEDVINFSLTCRRFHNALDNDLLWQTKLYQSFDIRWPYLKKFYDKRIQNKESINFKNEAKANVNVQRNVRKALFSYLSLLSKKFFNKEKWKISNSDIDFNVLFHPNIGAHNMNYHFLKDELLYQVKMSPLNPKCNLTHQYYSKILLPFLQRRHLQDASRLTKDMNLQISKNPIIPKNRTINMKYAVGMIVTCRITYGPTQTGVIIGWDERFNSLAEIKYRIIHSYQDCSSAEQPFYIILSEDGNTYYAAQDTLKEAHPRWIEHSEIGRYFCRFADICYVPNEVLTRHYPYDLAILNIHY